MKTNGARRALVIADAFNLLVAIYLIVIAIVSLVKLRWYHQLTVAIKTRHVITSATSYFAFFILLFAGVVLVAIFVISTIRLNSVRIYISSSGEEAPSGSSSGGVGGGGNGQSGGNQVAPISVTSIGETSEQVNHNLITSSDHQQATTTSKRFDSSINSNHLTNGRFSPIVIRDATGIQTTNHSAICCSILMHLLAGVSLIIVLVLWLLNTGELVRDSISTQLEYAFQRYQFTNRSNHYSVAIDGMQDINHCCGMLDYSDFPHQRVSGLSSGHYPGSCCGKSTFAVNARVLCTPEEIFRARQTNGCTTVLSNYYDLVSLLVVPVALVSLFVNITIIGLIVISKGHADALDFETSSHQRATAAAATANQNRETHQMFPMTARNSTAGGSKTIDQTTTTTTAS